MDILNEVYVFHEEWIPGCRSILKMGPDKRNIIIVRAACCKKSTCKIVYRVRKPTSFLVLVQMLAIYIIEHMRLDVRSRHRYCNM